MRDSQVPPFLKSYYKEKAAFESGKCPYCGSTDNRTKTCSEKQLKKEEKEAFEAAEKRVNTFFESVKNKNSQATASAETKNLSTENTKKFLLTAFNLEDNIFSLKKRLADLYVIDANLQAECDVFLWSEKRTQQIELEKLQEEYKLLQNYDFKKDIAYVAFSSDYPVWNEEQPAKLAEPSLKKAGLFNKKRVRLLYNEVNRLKRLKKNHSKEYESLILSIRCSTSNCNLSQRL